MTESQMTEALFNMFNGFPGFLDPAADIADISTFDELDYISRDPGLVITLRDGSQFEITVRQTE